MNKDKNITTSINHVHVYQYIISGQAHCQDWTNDYNQYNSHQSKQEIDHNQRYINDDKNICRDNLIELTPSGQHGDSLKYTNIPDNSSNHYTLTTNRTSAEKKQMVDNKDQKIWMKTGSTCIGRDYHCITAQVTQLNIFIPEQHQPIATEIHKQSDVLK